MTTHDDESEFDGIDPADLDDAEDLSDEDDVAYDDGEDISDTTGVRPEAGVVPDFVKDDGEDD